MSPELGFDVDHPEIVDCVRRALKEDIGTGDITSRLTVPEERNAIGRFFARESITLAGVELLPLIYRQRGGVDHLELLCGSGTKLEPGGLIATVEGGARRLLECERVALNFMQRLSGIATLASRYEKATAHTNCRVLDTRKTTPGLRRLEKMAAAAGGVVNHRMGLYDAVLIKNNHIAAAGSVTAAMTNARNGSADLPIEIEVRSREELDEALAAGATRLLLDNFQPQTAAELIRHIDGRAVVELSGNINLTTVRAYAETGADFVSCGAITHSAAAVDLNFRLQLL